MELVNRVKTIVGYHLKAFLYYTNLSVGFSIDPRRYTIYWGNTATWLNDPGNIVVTET